MRTPRILLLAAVYVAVVVAMALALAGIALAGQPPVRIKDLSPMDGATVGVGQQVAISGTVEADRGIGMAGGKPDVEVEVDGEPLDAELVVGSKAMTAAVRGARAFAPGPHVLRLTARDASGETASAETEFVAYSPVTISRLVPPEGAGVGVGREVVVSGSVESDHDLNWSNGKPDVKVEVDGAAIAVELVPGASKRRMDFSTTHTFAAGSHTLSVTARDVAGQSATAVSRFGADPAEAPIIRITDLVPPPGSTTGIGQAVVLSGYVEAEAGVMRASEPAVKVEVDGAPVAVEYAVGPRATRVQFRGAKTFAEGQHALSVTAVDAFGQVVRHRTWFAVGQVEGRRVDCRFVLGFARLQSQIGGIVGQCVTNEFVDRLTGDTLQLTTGVDGNGGLLVHRKTDNHVAYTDGYQTWVLGPDGFVERPRLNTERYPWEKERLTPRMLREGQYRLPLGPNDAEVAFKLDDGMAVFPNPRWPRLSPDATVVLGNGSTWYGDFDGDSYRDAVVVLEAYLGGSRSGAASGSGFYAVPVRDVDGQAVQLGHEFLGDRLDVVGVALGSGEFRVETVPWRSDDGKAGPTASVTRQFAVKLP